MVSDKKSDSKDTNVNLFLTEINFTISRIEQIMLGDDHLRPVSRDLRNSHEAFHSAIRNEESYSGYDSSLGEYESDSSDESCLVTEMNISDIESLDENYFESQNAVNDAEELIEADVGESHVNASQTFTLAGNSDVNSASDIKRSILAGKCDVAEFFKVLNNAGDNNVKNSFTKDNSKYWAQFFRKMNDDPEARLEQLAYLEPHHYKEVDEKFPGLLNNFKTFLIRLVEIQKKNALIKANASEGEQTLFKSIVSEENLLAKITPDMETKLAFAKVDPFFRRCINKSPVEILNRFVYNNTDINLNFNQKGLVGTIFGFPFKFIEDAFEIVDVFERDNLSSIRYIEVRIEINNKGIHIRDKVRVLSDLMRNLFAKLNNIAHLVFYIKELEKQYLDRTPNHAILFGLLAGFKSTRITTFTYVKSTDDVSEPLFTKINSDKKWFEPYFPNLKEFHLNCKFADPNVSDLTDDRIDLNLLNDILALFANCPIFHLNILFCQSNSTCVYQISRLFAAQNKSKRLYLYLEFADSVHDLAKCKKFEHKLDFSDQFMAFLSLINQYDYLQVYSNITVLILYLEENQRPSYIKLSKRAENLKKLVNLRTVFLYNYLENQKDSKLFLVNEFLKSLPSCITSLTFNSDQECQFDSKHIFSKLYQRLKLLRLGLVPNDFDSLPPNYFKSFKKLELLSIACNTTNFTFPPQLRILVVNCNRYIEDVNSIAEHILNHASSTSVTQLHLLINELAKGDQSLLYNCLCIDKKEGFESRVHWQNQSGGLRCINLKAPTDMELFLKLEKFGMRYN